MWDVFICHASEDKLIVRMLAQGLQQLGFEVWYDEYSLSLGDSLRRSIDHGISMSRFGLVILSHHFFAKEWPKRELDALTSIEVAHGKTILPVWHGVNCEDVRKFSPTLADKVAVATEQGIDEVLREVTRVLRDVVRSADGHDLRELRTARNWNRPKHEILRYVHSRVLIPKPRHNPIFASLANCIQSLDNSLDGYEQNTIRPLTERAHFDVAQSMFMASELQMIAEAVKRVCAFSRGEVTRMNITQLDEQVARLRAILREVHVRQAVFHKAVRELYVIMRDFKWWFFEETSPLRKTLLEYVVDLQPVVKSAVEAADNQLKTEGHEKRWSRLLREAIAGLVEDKPWIILGDAITIHNTLFHALYSLGRTAIKNSEASLQITHEPSNDPRGNFVRCVAATKIQYAIEASGTLEDEMKLWQMEIEDFGGDLTLEPRSEDGKISFSLSLISWDVYNTGVERYSRGS